MTTTPLLAATLVRGDRFRSFRVSASAAGWEAFAREDQRVLHERRHTDWHRVEQTLTRFTLEIASLRADGWRDAEDDHACKAAEGLVNLPHDTPGEVSRT